MGRERVKKNFVTMLWTLDVEGFRRKSPRFAASKEDVSKIQEMAIINLKQRASAAQMLVKCFNGDGLSTPRNQIPALRNSPPSAMATSVRAPASAPPALTPRTA